MRLKLRKFVRHYHHHGKPLSQVLAVATRILVSKFCTVKSNSFVTLGINIFFLNLFSPYIYFCLLLALVAPSTMILSHLQIGVIGHFCTCRKHLKWFFPSSSTMIALSLFLSLSECSHFLILFFIAFSLLHLIFS